MNEAKIYDVVEAGDWENGVGFPTDPASVKWLRKRKVNVALVTDDMVRRARRRNHERLRNGMIEFNQLARGKGVRRHFVVVGDQELDPELNPEMEGTARYRAEIAAQQKKEMLERLASLRKKKHAETHPDDRDESLNIKTERGTKMVVTILQARNLIFELGIGAHHTWTPKQVAAKLNALPDLLGRATKDLIEGSGSANLLSAISTSLQEGKPIMITDDNETDEKPKKAKKQKNDHQTNNAYNPKATSVPKKMSAIDAAYEVLRKSKAPLGTKALIEKMRAKGLWTSPGGATPHATLYSAILREIQTKGSESRFKKDGPGTFAPAR